MQENNADQPVTRNASRISIRSNRVRFAGAIDDRVIEDSGYTYSKAVLWAILVGICQELIGIVIMIITIYSLHNGKFHGAVFSMAYHFCAAEGILALSFINGWSTPMRKPHRQYAHIILQMSTLICAVIGVIVLTLPKLTASRSIHGLSGLLTLILTGTAWVIGPFLTNWLVGPIILRVVRPTIIIHKVVGLLCFLTSTICLCSGIVKNEFSMWAGKGVVSIMLGLVIFYSFIITYTLCMKYVKMIF